MTTLRTLGLSIFCGTLSVALLAQDARVAIAPRESGVRPASRANGPSANIRVNSDLVLVPVTVTDQSDRAITGLEKENFHLFDNGVEQGIRHFSSEDAPVSLAVVFDTSASMKQKLEKARTAVSALLAGSNPDDEFLLIEFNDNARVLASFTQEAEEIRNRLAFLAPHGRTALVDAACLALGEMKNARNARKAILIISDGGDNHSRYQAREIKERVQEADVQIYSIGIPAGGRRLMVPGEADGPALLEEFAAYSGGRYFEVNDASELSDIALKIGTGLRNQYLLGYSPPTESRDGRLHRLTVRLDPPKGAPKLRATFRSTYLAPEQ